MWFFCFEDLQSPFLQMTRWTKWKALKEINENRCPRPMTSELLSRFENYQVIWIRTARECKNWRFSVEMFWGSFIRKFNVISFLYTSLLVLLKWNCWNKCVHVYSEWIDLVKSLCVCRLILKLHIAKKLARYGTCQ